MPSGLTLGVLTRGTVSTDWAFALKKLAIPEDTDLVRLPGLPFDHARNEIVKRAIRNKSAWLFFLDDDVIPPWDAFVNLSAWKKPIVSGVYWKRQGDTRPTSYQESPETPVPVMPAGPQDVDFVGGGCLLIHMSVFSKIPQPWFKWTIDREDLKPRERLGEDFNFCRKARESGYQIFLDTNVRCKHEGQGWADEAGKFVPPPLLEL